MFQVIISTISTGRVQRRSFDSWHAAHRCFERFDAKRTRSGDRVYRVEMERRETPLVRALQPASASVPSAA
jgi:hypothetical protein